MVPDIAEANGEATSMFPSASRHVGSRSIGNINDQEDVPGSGAAQAGPDNPGPGQGPNYPVPGPGEGLEGPGIPGPGKGMATPEKLTNEPDIPGPGEGPDGGVPGPGKGSEVHLPGPGHRAN